MENIDWRILLTPSCIWIFIPIAAILSEAVLRLFKLYHRHTERMAMIERGLHPDLQEESDTRLLDRDNTSKSVPALKV